MENILLKKTLDSVARFYDKHQVGDVGPLGFRRSTELIKLSQTLPTLVSRGIIVPGETNFIDMGCADARVNIFLSYLSKNSVGIELDEWTLEEHTLLKRELCELLDKKDLLPPPGNIFLYNGDSTSPMIYEKIYRETGLRKNDFDVFYTYLIMYEEFARFIRNYGKPGAIFLVYGLDRIMPELEGFRLLRDISPVAGILAVYQKVNE